MIVIFDRSWRPPQQKGGQTPEATPRESVPVLPNQTSANRMNQRTSTHSPGLGVTAFAEVVSWTLAAQAVASWTIGGKVS